MFPVILLNNSSNRNSVTKTKVMTNIQRNLITTATMVKVKTSGKKMTVIRLEEKIIIMLQFLGNER